MKAISVCDRFKSSNSMRLFSGVLRPFALSNITLIPANAMPC